MRRDETKIHVEEQEVSIIRHAAGVFFSDDQFTPDGGAKAKLIRYGGISGRGIKPGSHLCLSASPSPSPGPDPSGDCDNSVHQYRLMDHFEPPFVPWFCICNGRCMEKITAQISTMLQGGFAVQDLL